MEIINIVKQSDGSANLKIDLNEEEVALFVEIGINKVLLDYIRKEKNESIKSGNKKSK